MRKKLLAILIATTLVVAVAVIVYAAYSKQYSLPQTATAPSPTNPISATFTINGQPWTDGSPINWGQLQVGANTFPIAITNTGSVAITSVSLNVIGLPSGWSETLTMGTAVGSTIPGTITLNADTSVSGIQSWSSIITLNSS